MKIKMNLNLYALGLAGAILITGCAQQPKQLYNYGNYSDSYYSYKKNVSPESTLALEMSIKQVIDKANESQSGRVPPGMYANLGYLQLKAGNTSEAIANFTKEKITYPESSFFMDKIIKRIHDSEEKKI
jgi:hypothetical protein